MLRVDHDHDTGKVRDLLCDACNKALGAMKENPGRFRAAAAYIEYWVAQNLLLDKK